MLKLSWFYFFEIKLKGSDFLAAEALEKIRFAEQNAEKVEQSAKNDGEKILEKAAVDAQEIVRKTKENGEELLKSRVEEAKIKADEISEGNKEALKEEELKLDEYAAKMKDAAIALIKNKLIS